LVHSATRTTSLWRDCKRHVNMTYSSERHHFDRLLSSCDSMKHNDAKACSSSSSSNALLALSSWYGKGEGACDSLNYRIMDRL